MSRAASRPSTAASEVLLALEGINLSFGGVKTLNDVGFAVETGSICAVIGPNGAGKSSLLNVISGLYRPDRGSIRFAGQAFRQMPTARLARLGIARTFQNLALFKGMNVIENVVMGRVATIRSGVIGQVLGLPAARREEEESFGRAEEIIAFLGLQGVRHRLAGSLPYGIQKRVELARALVAEPRLLLLDEPMAGTTVAEKHEMCAFILEAKAKLGTTIILIEHDIRVVMDLSDRVVVLDHGVKIADGLPEAVRNDPAVIDAYLGVEHG